MSDLTGTTAPEQQTAGQTAGQTAADEPQTTQPVQPVQPVEAPAKRASVLKVVRDQRKTVMVALGLAVASYWVIGQLGEWRLATCLALGVALGLVNHLATEYWLLRIISSGEQPSRGQMVRATMVRLVGLTAIAVALAVWLWPDGIGLLLGLAIFRLLALMMTSVTLLKELKSE